jgi:hypothetical protein
MRPYSTILAGPEYLLLGTAVGCYMLSFDRVLGIKAAISYADGG